MRDPDDTQPAPPPTFDMLDTIEQLPPESGARLVDPWALRFDWDGFASEDLDDDAP